MPHHYTKNTVEVTIWGRTCNKPTPHYVFDGRLGRCKNDHPHAGRKHEPQETQGDLFNAQRIEGGESGVE